jgi:hypothetical protein
VSENERYYCRVTLIDLGDVAALNESGMFAGFAVRRCLHRSVVCPSDFSVRSPQK